MRDYAGSLNRTIQNLEESAANAVRQAALGQSTRDLSITTVILNSGWTKLAAAAVPVVATSDRFRNSRRFMKLRFVIIFFIV